MRPTARRLAGLVAAGTVLAAAVASQADARTSILYDSAEAVQTIVRPGQPGGLGPARGALRQDPGPGGLFQGGGADAQYRVAKVNAEEIENKSPEEIAALLRSEIDQGSFGATSHVVAVDEIGNEFNDGRYKLTYRTVKFRGKTLRLGSHLKLVVTKNGWKLKRRQTEFLPEIDPDSPASRLSAAMKLLDAQPAPWGGTYASRVHFYIAPAFVTSIGAGRGEHRNLGNDGKPHRATWRGVMPALARSGGVWLEMYHGIPGSTAFTAKEWRTAPAAFDGYLRRFGGATAQLHFLMSGTPKPARATGCSTPMSCQWMLAETGGVNRAIMGNGVGVYKVGDQAAEWLQEFNKRYPD